MAFDPTFDPYTAGVAVASGVVAAAMHATAMAGSGKAWPARRVMTANLISTALVGIVVSQIIRFLPWKADMVVTLLAAGITGHTLGPRGVAWAFSGMVKGAQQAPVIGKLIPDPPPDEATPTPPDPQLTEAKDA
ncbi:MAG: hypothetical protein Q4C89_12230 [Deinococcus sp.]|uniref:hypothetical protein n=1 Tax=Deinococcus sp. TaxID=47478 RepID=UPI0026DC67D6|nr:hypothetical protein [Deinococcus sp.]MDO4246783.1 hypothetical protein [Deinococcus sp.]